jgi:hypothetical protein
MLAALRIDYDASFEISKLGMHRSTCSSQGRSRAHQARHSDKPVRGISAGSEAGGYMCHVIDNTDHYAHDDKSINYVNFLQFEDWQWRLLTINPFAYTIG